MNFKIGETFKIKDTELLVLDIIDGNPFVIALDTGIKTKFSDDNTDYASSILLDKAEEWFEELDVPAISRTLDLTTMDGSKCYGTLDVDVAPLTFDEFRKYAEIIIPHIKNYFWLATAWADPKWKNWGTNFACRVSTGGTAGYDNYANSRYLAPAFILDKSFFDEQEKYFNIDPDPHMLSNYTTEALLAEIARRVNN